MFASTGVLWHSVHIVRRWTVWGDQVSWQQCASYLGVVM